MKWSVKWMEVWLGGSKEDATRTNGWIRSWKKCGMSVRWDQWPESCSEVKKPRLSAHLHRDACAERKDLLLDIYHKSWQAPPPNDHKVPIRDVNNVHDHGSARAERVRPYILLGKSESGCPHSLAFLPDDGDDA